MIWLLLEKKGTSQGYWSVDLLWDICRTVVIPEFRVDGLYSYSSIHPRYAYLLSTTCCAWFWTYKPNLGIFCVKMLMLPMPETFFFFESLLSLQLYIFKTKNLIWFVLNTGKEGDSWTRREFNNFSFSKVGKGVQFKLQF